MELAKKLNIFSLGVLVVQSFYFFFAFLFKESMISLFNGRSTVKDIFLLLLIFFVLAFLVIYLIFTIRSKTKYNGWKISSMIFNLIGSIVSASFWIYGFSFFLNCISRHGEKCSISLVLVFFIGLVFFGIAALIGLILLGIGVWRDKKGENILEEEKSEEDVIETDKIQEEKQKEIVYKVMLVKDPTEETKKKQKYKPKSKNKSSSKSKK